MKKFAADFSRYGKASLYFVEIGKETDKTFSLESYKKIFGGYIYFGSRNRKDNFELFEHLSEALLYLIAESERYSEKLAEKVRLQEEQYDKLVDLFREAETVKEKKEKEEK